MRRPAASVPIVVDSNLKIGQFSFSEQDLQIRVNGIPLTVVRTYNSLNPRTGDFGYCWTYSLNSMDVQLDDEREDVIIGSDKAPLEHDPEGENQGPEQVSIRTGGGWDVTLTLPDGRRTTFVFDPIYAPAECKAYARWTAPADVHATLTVYPAGHDEIVAMGSPYWADDDASCGLPLLANHDLPGWVLTDYDGTAYFITRGACKYVYYDPSGNSTFAYVPTFGPPKLTRIVQRTGDTIVIEPDRIYHQNTNGTTTRSFWFERDGQNRITAIQDPISGSNGVPVVKYVYDEENGNLLQVLTARVDPWPARPGAACLKVAVTPDDYGNQFHGSVDYRVGNSPESARGWFPMDLAGEEEDGSFCFTEIISLEKGFVYIQFRISGAQYQKRTESEELEAWKVEVG